MASSSSSSPLPKYDVFLSFRGEDTRDNIVSHLVDALKTKKIETFIDDENLKRGDEISPALISAIEQSKISVIIFSENYAESRWCLEELVKIIECKKELSQIVIPVFYKVDPTHVRNQTGEFGSAFVRLLKIYEIKPVMIFAQNFAPKSAKLQIWSDALKSAANLSGYSYINGSEATLVDKIIGDVLEKLKIGSNNPCDDMGLVGINSRVKKIMHLLDIESLGFGMVGIWGMGGIGKTTIAGQVFNKIKGNFDSCCFLRDVKEQVNKEGLPKMRDKLMSELLKDNKLEIHTPRIGDGSIKDRLRRTKVLVVLDDVDDSLQLEELIGERRMNQFGEGSRIIVTTRDKHVLKAHDITCVYDMDMLDDRDALELFAYHALRPDQPMEPYLEISKKIVEYAQGVPLALKILGSSLHGKTHIDDWKGELKKLKKLPNMKILGVLKTSYDSLSDEEKDIFLDISCFFKGMDVNKIRNVLDGGYVSLRSGMDVLIDKSLIYITPIDSWIWDPAINVSIDVVEMHDLVQEMGSNIVTGESKEVGSRSRLWRDENVRDVLTKNTGTDKIKAILYDFTRRKVNKINLDPQAFAKMHNLKFLQILSYDQIEFPSGLESLPEGLRYLYWHKCPLESWPPTFNPTNLVELHLIDSPLKRLWSGTQDLSSLKVLCFNFCPHLIEIPDLSRAVNLEELSFHSDDILEIFSSSIKHLNSLHYLNLSWCYSLKEIRQTIKNLKNLAYLNLNHCISLNEIPSSIQHLNSLTHLKLGGCTKITKLPNLPHHIKFLQVDWTLIEVYSLLINHPFGLLTNHPFGLLTNLVELELLNCTIDQSSSIFLEQIQLLLPQGCKIIRKDRYGSMELPTSGLQF